MLRWRDEAGNIVHTSFAIRHRLEIQVNGPKPAAIYRGTQIEFDQISEHRMEATDEEILGIDRNATVADLRRARRESAKVYHVDKHQHLEQGVQDVLTLRMKERNAAADRVLARLKAKPKA